MAASSRVVRDHVVSGGGLGVAAYRLAVQAELGGDAVDADALVVQSVDLGVPTPGLGRLYSLRPGGLGGNRPGFSRRIQTVVVCADGLLDGVAQVFPDVPSIRDLDSVGRRSRGAEA